MPLKAVSKTITVSPIKPTAAMLKAKAKTKKINTIDSINNSVLSLEVIFSFLYLA